MKVIFTLFLVSACFFANPLRAQDSTYRYAIRIYEDNDFIKLFGDISDKGYTNGTRLDYYYVKEHKPRFFLDRWMPKAGRTAINTFGLGLTQLMFTPADEHLVDPDVKDWPYTGALYLSHTLHSSNPAKGYNIQTELIGGVIGRASGAKEVQDVIHKLINSDEFQGWDKQYPTDIALNLNLGMEKRIWQYRGALEVIGGGRAMLGTMMDGGSLYALVRIGKMLPYFDGFLQQYSRPFAQQHKFQLYVFARPGLEWTAYNAILQGGLFAGKSDYYKSREADAARINHNISRRLDLGLVASYGCVGLSFSQSIMQRFVEGLYHERLGNLTLYVSW